MAFSDDTAAKVYKEMQWLNVILGTMSALLVYISCLCALSLWISFAVSMMVAASPHLVSYSVYMLTEPVAVFFISLIPLIQISTLKQRTSNIKPLLWMLLGLILGILCLFRPIYILLPLAFLIGKKKSQPTKRMASCIFIGFLLILGPWWIRNIISVEGDNRPYSSLSMVMVVGSYPGYMYKDDPKTFPYANFSDPGAPSAMQNTSSAAGEIIKKILDDPWRMLKWYLYEKSVYLWQWSNIEGMGDVFIYPVASTPYKKDPLFIILHKLFMIAHPALIVISLIGSLFAYSKSASAIIPENQLFLLKSASLLIIYTQISHIPLQAVGRFAVPVYPEVFIVNSIIIISVINNRHRIWRFFIRKLG